VWLSRTIALQARTAIELSVRPLAVDLYCGLGGWTEGLLAAGFYVVGFDNVRHEYGEHRYPAQLVIQDVLTLHGRQFKDAALIVASPPCQDYSYMAMPWKRAKKMAAEYRDGTRDVRQLTALFDACFRLQREACAAAGRHVPMVVENVRGAIPWVGRSRWHHGSFYLWGDVPALMPVVRKGHKIHGHDSNRFKRTGQVSPGWTDSAAVKNAGGSWFAVSHNKVPHSRGDDPREAKRRAGKDAWFATGASDSYQVRRGGRSKRKMASAMIAMIPFALSSWIARTYLP
jgi:C-5 cytosine-specific DNA methylase